MISSSSLIPSRPSTTKPFQASFSGLETVLLLESILTFAFKIVLEDLNLYVPSFSLSTLVSSITILSLSKSTFVISILSAEVSITVYLLKSPSSARITISSISISLSAFAMNAIGVPTVASIRVSSGLSTL